MKQLLFGIFIFFSSMIGWMVGGYFGEKSRQAIVSQELDKMEALRK